MPFYDYKCNKCHKKFEACHGMSGKPEGLKCEFCGSTDIARIFQAVRTLNSDLPDLKPIHSSSRGGGCSSCSSGACSSCH